MFSRSYISRLLGGVLRCCGCFFDNTCCRLLGGVAISFSIVFVKDFGLMGEVWRGNFPFLIFRS